jgi:hypothetical protein
MIGVVATAGEEEKNSFVAVEEEKNQARDVSSNVVHREP